MVEEWWSFEQKGDCLWVTHFKHRSLHKYTRVAGEEGYAVICVGCEGSERYGTRPFRSPCCTV